MSEHLNLLDPDMPVQALRLSMGELTASEVRVARAAIRWANTCHPEPKTVTREELVGLLRREFFAFAHSGRIIAQDASALVGARNAADALIAANFVKVS